MRVREIERERGEGEASLGRTLSLYKKIGCTACRRAPKLWTRDVNPEKDDGTKYLTVPTL
jgi:hypothetical protein